METDRVLRLVIIPEIRTDGNDNDAMEAKPEDELIHVSSQVLKAKSGFFRKLFTTGMAEASQQEVTIKVTAREKPIFVLLIQHMTASWPLIGLQPDELFPLLLLSQQYDAKECMRYCCVQLKYGMCEEDALCALQLIPYLQMEQDEDLRSLTAYAIKFLGDITTRELSDETKNYFVSEYKDIERFEKEILGFPLNIFVAIISSDHLEVSSEDVVYHLVCKWTKANYPQINVRYDVRGQLAKYIRFRYMPLESLKKVSSSRNFDTNVIQPLVLDALFFKTDVPQNSAANQHLIERVYTYRPVRVLKFKMPQTACVIYLELPHVVCKNMSPTGHVYSEKFELDNQGIYLFAACQDQGEGASTFGLFLEATKNNEIGIEFEFAARAKPLGMFKVVHSSRGTLTKGRKVGSQNLFMMLWDSFIEEDGEYFCGGALHLRVDIKLINDKVM